MRSSPRCERAVRLIRNAVIGAAGLAAIPIVVSINRGLWIAPGVAVVFVGVRLAAAGRTKVLLGGARSCVVLAAVIVLSPLGGLIHDGSRSSHNSNGTRSTLYAETFRGVGQSPLFGFGSPRASAYTSPGNDARVGTQGQFYLVLFSHGYPGAALLPGLVRYSRSCPLRRRTVTESSGASVILMSFTEMMVYDFLPVRCTW